MKVIIRSEWPDVVRKCIFGEPEERTLEQDGSILTLSYGSDYWYREMAIWLGHALACGLILRGEIER